MQIGIDIRPLTMFADKAGLYWYVYNLVSNLVAIDSRNRYTLLSTVRGFRGDERIPTEDVRRVPGRLSYLCLEKLSLPVEFLVGPASIFHGPAFFIPHSLRSKSVLTVHDLMFLTHPQFLQAGWVADLKKKVSESAHRADAVIAVSHFTKGEIVGILNVPAERVRVIHNGASADFRPIRDLQRIERIEAKYGVTGPYILFVSAIEPKKNLIRVIQACTRLRRDTHYKYPLVVVGSQAWHFERVLEEVRELECEKETIFTGIVEADDLPCLYSGAALFVFPSLYEGFGIPVIEAMACGTPVVTSNRASIPEIAGDAALLVDPLNVDEIAGAMLEVLSKPQVRRRLVEKGLQRAKAFSWERTARETLKLYQDVA